MANPLAILISAKLNSGLAIKDLNTSIKALGKHPSLQKLDLKLNIDKSFISSVSSLSKNLNTITSQLQQQSAANNNVNSSLKSTTQSIQEQTKATNEAIKAEKKWQVEREKTNSKDIKTVTLGNNVDNSKQKVTYFPPDPNTGTRAIKNIDNVTNQLKDYKAVEALDRDHYNALKSNQAKIEAMDKVHYLALQKNREMDWKNLQAANKQFEALDKAHYQAIIANNDMIAKNQKQTQSLINSAFSGKQQVNSPSNGVTEAKALEVLNRQYDKVLSNLNNAKNSGNQLTVSELSGINRRIEALNNLASRQKSIEKDRATLSSAQLRAETQVNNLLSGRYKDKVDAPQLTTLLNQLKALDTQTANFKGKTKEITDQINRISAEAKNASPSVQGLGDTLKKTFSSILMYAGVGSIFYASINALKQMTQTIVEVDSQLTQLKRVMDEDTDFNSMMAKSIDLANELGRSIKEVNENAIGFARMGFDESQTIELAKTATLFQNISDLTPTEAVDTLTAAMTVFNIEASKSIEVANKINEVDNNFAVSSQGLALSINKSASAAKTFGVSLEKLIGDTTAITTATRESGAVVGNALKTIYSRLTTMEKSEGTLADVGIKMRDLNNEVKDAPVILDELASKWGSLSKEQQQNTAVNLAGRFQLSRFLALMQNYQISINATETALHSQGSAVSENEKYMQSLEARIQKMKTAWDTLALAMGNAIISDSVVVITSLLTSLGNVLTSTIEHFGALPVIFGVISSGIYLLNASIRAFVTNLLGITTSATVATGALGRMTAALSMVKVGMRSLMVSSLVGVAFAGLGFILEKVIGHFSKASEVIGETESSLDSLKDKTGNLKELQDLSNEYNSLANNTNKTTEEKIRLASVESDLASKHGVTMKTVEDQTDAVQANTAAITERIDKLKEEAAIEQQKALDEYKANKTKINSDIQKQKSARDTAQAEVDSLTTIQKNLEKSIANKETIKNDKGQLGNFTSYQTVIKPEHYDISGLDGISESIAQAIIDAKKKVDSSGLELDKALSKREQRFKAEFSAIADTIEASGTEVKASTRVLADGFASIIATSDVDDLKILEQYKNEVFAIFQNTDITSLDDAIAALERFAGSEGLKKEQFDILQTSISALNFQGINDGVEGLGDESESTEKKVLSLADAMKALDNGLNGSESQINDFIGSISAAKDDIDLLDKAQSELSENNILSSQTIKAVSEKYSDFIKVTGLSKDAIYKFIKAKKEEKNVVIQSEMNKTKKTIEETSKRIAAMKDEYTVMVALINAHADDLTSDNLALEVRAIHKKNQFSEEEKMLEALNTKYSILTNTLSDFKTGSSDTKKETDKLTDSYSDTVEILTELQKQLKNIKKLQDEEESKRRRMRQSSKEYQDSLKKTIDLKKQELALLEKGAKDPSQLVSAKVQTTVKTSSDNANTTSTSVNSGSSSIDNMLSNALGLQGKFTYKQVSGKFQGTYEEFVKGATSDCSQFVQEMFDEFLNINLPRTAAEQAKQGVSVSKADLQAGDLVFFNTTGKDNSHVGIYTGNGKFVQMGNSGLKEQDLNSKTWTEKYTYNGAKRVASSPTQSASSSGVTTNKSGNTTTKTTGATTSEIEKAAEQNEQDKINLKNEITDAEVQFLEWIKYVADNAVEEQEHLIAASQKRQEKLDPTSDAFKKENQVQVNIQSKIQGIKNQESLDLQKSIKEFGIESDEYDKLIKQLQTERADLQSEKYKKLVENITLSIDATKEHIAEIDNLIEQSQNRMAESSQGTPEYNKELNLQIELKKKQKKENEELVSSLENLIKSENLDAATKKNLKSILDDLKLKDYIADIKELNNELISSKSFPLEEKLATYNYQLDLSESKMKSYVEGSKEFNDEVQNQLSILKNKISVTEELIAYEEIQSRNEELTSAAREDHNNKLRQYTLSLYDYKDAVKSLLETYADRVIEDYKNLLQEQQKLQKAAYQKEKELENERHETRMDNLEKELSAFEDNINAQSKSLDRDVAEEDYTDQLAKLQKEKSELDGKFSNLLLDNSLDAKLKRSDLQKEIDAKTEEITKLQRDREITIRKDGLSDQLEDRKNAVDKEKKLEDDKNKAFIKNLENLEKINDDYYDGLLNDEQYFYNMKQALMSGDTVRIQNELGIVQAAYTTFYQELEKNSSIYAEKIASNLKYAISLDEEYAKNYPQSSTDSGSTSNGSTSSSSSSGTGINTNERDSVWKEYLSNKQKAEQLKVDMRTLIKESDTYKNKQSQFEKLNNTNLGYRSKYGFPDGSYDELKNITKYHNGGEVGVEGTTTKKWWDNFEVPALLKKSEVVLDRPRDFFSEIVGNIKNNLSNALANVIPSLSTSGKGAQAIDNSLSIHIGNITGDKKGAKIVTDSIEELWKKKTKQGW